MCCAYPLDNLFVCFRFHTNVPLPFCYPRFRYRIPCSASRFRFRVPLLCSVGVFRFRLPFSIFRLPVLVGFCTAPPAHTDREEETGSCDRPGAGHVAPFHYLHGFIAGNSFAFSHACWGKNFPNVVYTGLLESKSDCSSGVAKLKCDYIYGGEPKQENLGRVINWVLDMMDVDCLV